MHALLCFRVKKGGTKGSVERIEAGCSLKFKIDVLGLVALAGIFGCLIQACAGSDRTRTVQMRDTVKDHR